ncbi:MAG: hypothetical protein K1000chlam2_01259 [Chlamydiae bacterium]|nr:hypothetical protein [Chlamydiota bacterium]
MYKYFGWIFAAMMSLTLVSAFAEDNDADEAATPDAQEEVAVADEATE